MIGLLFFVSGLASLVYQIATMKLFSLLLGSSVLASTLTISGYMVGLALGARWIGERADHFERPLRRYGQLELAIAVSGILVPAAAAFLDGPLFAGLLPEGDSATPYLLAKGSLGLLALLVPTTLMGGTLPVLVKELIRRRCAVDDTITFLYALNALGAAAGALLAGFLLLPSSGIRATLATALVLYAVIGLAALRLDKDAAANEGAAAAEGTPGEDADPAAGEDTPEPGGDEPAGAHLEVGEAMILLGGTGFALMALEHVWFRYFILVMDSSTYSFSVLVSGVILGIGLGSLAGNLWHRTRPLRVRNVVILLGLEAAALLLSLPWYDDLPDLFLWVRAVAAPGWWSMTAFKFLLGLSLMVIPAACSGYLFPAIMALACEKRGEEAARVGKISAVNTLGTVAGIVLATFVLVPWLGLQGTVEFQAGLLLVLAAMTWSRIPATEGRPLSAAVLTGLVLVGYLGLRPAWEWRRIGSAAYRSVPRGSLEALERYWRELEEDTAEVLMIRHGTLATVSVERHHGKHLSLRINGKVEASTGSDMPTQLYTAHLPLLLHPAPRDALVIGLGSAVTGGAARLHDLDQLDQCEIEPAVVEAARLFEEANRGVLDAPDHTLFVEDARTLLMRREQQYDVIIAEPTNPWVAGIAGLFSREHLRRIRRRLRPGGIFLQWFHLYECDVPTASIVFRTLQETFPGATVWLMGTADIAFVAPRDDALEIDPEALRRRLAARPEVAADLARAGLSSIEAILGTQVFTPEGVAAWGNLAAPINTDDFQVLEYEAPFAFFEGRTIDLGPPSPDTFYDRLPAARRTPAVRREVGLYFARHANGIRVLPELTASLEANPDDPEARYWLADFLASRGLVQVALEHLLEVAIRHDPSLRRAEELILATSPADLATDPRDPLETLLDILRRRFEAGDLDGNQLLDAATMAAFGARPELEEAALRRAAALPDQELRRRAEARLEALRSKPR